MEEKTKTMRIICTGAVVPLLAILILVAPVAAVSTITGPTVITEPGEYRLANDIVNTDAPVCIDVRTGGVTIDGGGHRIDGVKSPSSIGICVQWTASAAPDTIVKNIRFTDWGSGIQIYKAVHSKVRFCTFTDDTIGLEAYCAEDAEVSSCTFVGNGDGVSLAGTTDAVIRDSTYSGNTNGIVVGAMLRCYNVTISSNVIDGSTDTGILLDWTGGPITIQTNRVTNSGRVGLLLNDMPGHVITNNLFNNMNNADFPVGGVALRLNTTKTAGPNIVGGPFIGGNYWAAPGGTGFSETHPDTDGDGFCEVPFVTRGGAIDYLPLTTPAVAAVQGGTGRPTDTNADGLYDDVNGNGRRDFADVVLYFNQMTWIAANEPVALFDYNGNGRIDFADVVWLFNHL